MGTTVNYGPLTLKNCLTLEFNQTPIRDPSGTDRWYNETSIRVMCIANPRMQGVPESNISMGVIGVAGGDIDAFIHNVLCALGRDRQSFSYEISGVGTKLIEWDVSRQGPDNDNGPKVMEATCTTISTAAVRIIFAIKIAGLCCGDPGSPNEGPGPIRNNRWCLSDEVDENFRTTRTFRGLIRLEGPTTTTTNNPQAFRQFAFPPLSDGFKRKHMNFAASMSGLELAYEITDEEMIGQAAPAPATKMIGFHSELLGQQSNYSIGKVSIRLEGPKWNAATKTGADPRVLIELAMQIVVQKLDLQNAFATSVVQSLQVVCHIGDGVNAVECSGQVQHTITAATSGSGETVADGGRLGSMVMNELGKPLKLLDYNDQQALLLGPYGTASFATLLACYLQDPCAQSITYSGADTAKSAAVPKERKQADPPPDATITVVGPGTSISGWGRIPYSPDQGTGLYTFAQVDTTTRKVPMELALPVALSEDDERKGLDTVAVVRLGPAISYLTVRIAMERTANWPTILTDAAFTDQNGIRYTPVNPGSVTSLRAPSVNQDGKSKFYSLDFEAEYCMSRPLRQGESFAVGSLPWDSTPASSNKMPATALIDPSYPKGIS